MPEDPVQQSTVQAMTMALAVPVLIVDYSAVVGRFQGEDLDRVRERLISDHHEFLDTMKVLRHVAVSPEWVAMAGDPVNFDPPPEPLTELTAVRYPQFYESLVDQLLAPSRGVTSMVAEHTVPSRHGDAIVRSHWRAPTIAGQVRYDRVVVMDLDVTDMRRTQRVLEQTLEAKDRFVASVSHELRNSLTSVLGLATLLQSDDQLDAADQHDMVDMLANQTRDAVEMLTDMLTASVGEALRVTSECTDLDTILEAIDLSDIRTDTVRHLSVVADPLRVRQIVRNLLSNAEKHGGSDRRLVAERQGDQVLIRVLDNGKGIDPALVGRLFEPYVHSGKAGSTGLGLFVSRTLARAMDGGLSFERTDGWTCFTLAVPANPST